MLHCDIVTLGPGLNNCQVSHVISLGPLLPLIEYKRVIMYWHTLSIKHQSTFLKANQVDKRIHMKESKILQGL